MMSEANSSEAVFDDDIDEQGLSRQGIQHILDNKFEEAQSLFEQYKEVSAQMNAGHSFVIYLRALMSFEDAQLATAMKALEETEKRCTTSDGFVKSIKNKFSGKQGTKASLSIEERLKRQVHTADAILFQAILTFTGQDISSYVKGGWLLRKSWKVYEKSYKEINELNNRLSTSVNKDDIHNSQSCADLKNAQPNEGNLGNIPRTTSMPSADALVSADQEISKESAERLLGGVSFGYGVLQLCISMVPAKVLKLIEFLGFNGDREVGLNAIEYASKSTDMRAPMAMLTLLWYHTAIRQFFALDGANTNAGVEEATAIIESCESQYPDSALFLWFKGRVLRTKRQLDESLAIYNLALEKSRDQREIQVVCHYEIGWSHLMKMNYETSLNAFLIVIEESKWSKSFYKYLIAICQGALGDIAASHQSFKEVPGLVKRKQNQIEAFVMRRSATFKKKPPTQDHALLLAMELVYLWNSFPMCQEETFNNMLQECGKLEDKKLFHLRSLIEGAIYKQMGDVDFSLQCFEEVLARHEGKKEDIHVVAFAMYELGTVLIMQPDTEERGKTLLLKARDGFKEYDFENRLHVRINAALRRAKENGAGTSV